jgi:hypothetical protein
MELAFHTAACAGDLKGLQACIDNKQDAAEKDKVRVEDPPGHGSHGRLAYRPHRSRNNARPIRRAAAPVVEAPALVPTLRAVPFCNPLRMKH